MALKDISELTRSNEELRHEVAERERMEVQLGQRTHLLSTLLEVSNLVTSSLELKPFLEAILDKLKTIIDYDGAKIFIKEGSKIRLAAHRSPLSPDEELIYVFPYNTALIGMEVIEGKKPVIIPDVCEDTEMAGMFKSTVEGYLKGTLNYVRSWMGLPLFAKDRVIGALTVDHREPDFYHPQHIELGMAFANQAAMEFENVRLYRQTLKRADEMRTMLAVQRAITSRLDLDAVLQLIADEARRLTGSEGTAVFLVDGSELVLSVLSGSGQSLGVGYRFPIEKSVMGQNLLQGKSIITRDACNDAHANRELVSKWGVKSSLSIPLIAGSKPVGVIDAKNKLGGEFDEEDERILNILASSAVIGIENARMYQEERRRHQEDEQRRYVAEGLRDILAILNSNRPLDEILDYITREAARLMGTDSGALFRLQKDRGILTIRAACGLPDEFLEMTAVPVGAGTVGQAAVQRKPIVVTDIAGLVSRSAAELPRLKRQLEWIANFCKGLVAIPLLCKDEVYGCIVLYMKQEREFSREEIGLATSFAYQAALAIDNARLREQAEKIAVTAERSRLARDLHDAVTQTLFSSSLIAEVLPRIWERSQEEGQRRIEELKQLTRGALAEMRTLLLELRPTALTEAGFEELLKHLAESVAARARIPVALKIEGCKELPTDVKIALYRITQEALNNIVKHSGAGRAAVNVKSERDAADGKERVELVVDDNGKGFNPQQVAGDHIGLDIMQERADVIGAKLEVSSVIGKGTKITVHTEYPCPI